MRIQIARLVKSVTFLCLWGIVLAPTLPLRAEPDTVKTKQRLSRSLANLARQIDEIKWTNVTIYRLQDEFKQRLIVPQMQMASKDSVEIEKHRVDILTDGTDAENLYQNVMRIASTAAGKDVQKFIEKLADNFSKQVDDVDPQVADQVLNLAKKIINDRKNIPKDYFLITSRDRSQPLLMALVGIEDAPGGGFNLKGATWGGIDLYDNVKKLDPTLYDEMREAVFTGNSPFLANQMFTLRDLAEIQIVPRSVGNTRYLDEDKYPYVLLSVSNGRPLRAQDSTRMIASNLNIDPTLPGKDGAAAMPNAYEYPYEISVGSDVLASFMAYKTTSDTLPFPDPDWGVELKTGFDEINIPSVWGGRMTLNAILENIKIGAVLPVFRFGDSTIETSGIGSNRQRLLGGYGLAVSGDFSAPLLANSGLFNFYLSYTFSESNAKSIMLSGETTDPIAERGYIIRYATQLYYSFGFYADPGAKNLFRLKVGGTAYGVDTYTRRYDPQDTNPAPDQRATILQKEKSETFGGISGKIEFMRTGQRTPWGIGLQYLDQSILGNVWIQFAVTPRLDLKIEGKYFTPLNPKERPETHPWENPSLMVPSASVKYHF
ncbi:MAG: hypothetical protein JST22_05670 [Bacteroidetes bacterium]|nr:hypothetical protein [Bacteroidota bacterium]